MYQMPGDCEHHNDAKTCPICNGVKDCTTCAHSTDNGGNCMGCDDCSSETFDGWEAIYD